MGVPPGLPRRPEELQQVVYERLLTPEELAKKIAEKPTEPYHALADELTGLEAFLNQVMFADANRDTIAEVGRRLGAIGNAAEAPAKQESARDKARPAKDIRRSVADYQARLPDLMQAVQGDPALRRVRQRLTLGQAFTAKRCGIAFADCAFDDFNDRTELECRENFGAGALNSVAKIKYAGEFEGIFKPEPVQDDGGSLVPSLIGIDNLAPHFGNRNIASAEVSRLLGADVIVGSRFAIHNGRIGLLMDKAPGRSPRQTSKVDVEYDLHFAVLLAAGNTRQLGEDNYEEWKTAG